MSSNGNSIERSRSPAAAGDFNTLKRKNEQLESELESLKKRQARMDDNQQQYYASNNVRLQQHGLQKMPEQGSAARHCQRKIQDYNVLDFNPHLNTSSYVNVIFEPEELAVANLGLSVNLADQTVYPKSFELHNKCINMVAQLWNCPVTDEVEKTGVFAGAGTVGSTEACLLAGLAFKFRWREWYAKKYNKSAEEVLGVRPNLVITTMYQAAWEKFFKYMDIEPKFVDVAYSKSSMRGHAEDFAKHIDEKTIGVVAIMGNHYGGHYDPVQEIDAMLSRVNKEKGFQVGIHVDAASGGFIAPFQKDIPKWDFRLPNVLSISASGHKFGVSCCGTGWVVWRQREGLSEHVAISVSYLGGHGDSYTLNFSRPATGVYVQMYQFLRLGHTGYTNQMLSQMFMAEKLRDHLKSMKYKGKNRFIIMDDVPNGLHCLPVVSARLNPDCHFPYDDIDFQHAIAEHQWYVSGYGLNFKHPITEQTLPLFSDLPSEGSMFRVVVKANITEDMMDTLIKAVDDTVEFLDSVEIGYCALHSQSSMCVVKKCLESSEHSMEDAIKKLEMGEKLITTSGATFQGKFKDVIKKIRNRRHQSVGAAC